jgi:hypothetical protein
VNPSFPLHFHDDILDTIIDDLASTILDKVFTYYGLIGAAGAAGAATMTSD